MLDTLCSLLALGAMLLAAYGVGQPLARRLRLAECDPLADGVWSLGLGLLFAGIAWSWLGFAGLLYPELIAGLTVAAGLAGLRRLARGRVEAMVREALGEPAPLKPIARVDPALPPPPRFWLGTMAALAALLALGSLVGALVPPTAGDALCYHLELPKQFLAAGALVYDPYSDNSAFPLLVEMWFLWGLALDGPVAASLMHWAAGLLLALAATLLARPLTGSAWAWFAGGLTLLAPVVGNEMSAPLNDVGLALFTTLGLAAWQEAFRRGDARWFLVAGLCLGGALATKHLGLVFLAALVPAAVWSFFREPALRRARRRGLGLALMAIALVAGPWYVRGAWHTGNPVYPFFCEAFGVEGPDANPDTKRRLGQAPLQLFAAVWHATMNPEELGGRGHQPGVLFLACLPLLLVARRRVAGNGLLTTAAVYWLLWFLLRQNVRFLLPLLPLLAVAVARAGRELVRFPPPARAAVAALAAPVLAVYAALPLVQHAGAWQVVCGLLSREAYLAAHEPTFALAQASRGLPPEARILSQDHRAFYFARPLVREAVFRRRTEYQARQDDPAALAAFLKEQGFTHLLVAESDRSRGVRFNRVLAKLARGPLAPWLECQFQHAQADSDGQVREYRLLGWK